jgi:hypothetical protein
MLGHECLFRDIRLSLHCDQVLQELGIGRVCWMVSKNGIFIWTCLNTSRMFSNFPPFLGACNLSE